MSITQVGQDGTGWTPTGSFAGNGIAYYFKNGYACALTTTMKAAHVRVATVGTATIGRVSIYSGVGPGATFVAQSADIDLTQTGDRSAPIVGNLTPGQYTVVFQQFNSGLATSLVMNSGASLFVDNQNTSGNFPYASPPAILPAADAASAGAEFAFWIETAANAVGQDGTGWTPVNVFAGNGTAYYFKNGYSAPVAANMKAAHITVNQVGPEQYCRVYVYAGVGPGSTFVAMSSEIDVTQLGDRSASIAGLLNPGVQYTLVVQNKSTGASTQLTGNSGGSIFVCGQNTSVNFPYGVPPSVLPAADASSAGAEFEVWIEGGGGIALVNTIFTPNLVAPIRITPAAAVVALASSGPTLAAQSNPIPATASLPLIGAAVRLALGITPSAGASVISGIQPTVTRGASSISALPLVGGIQYLGYQPNVTVTSTQGSGFQPNSGFTFTGTPQFDQPFTISVTDGRFGATGPILALFDDFRGAVAGVLNPGVNPSVPVAGNCNYSAGFSNGPIFARTNRGGVKPAMSILNNEIAGQPAFGRSCTIPFGSHTNGVYYFYAENWRSSWDGTNVQGAGGGYYKMVWLMGDNDSPGGTDADSVSPVFLEIANNDLIQTMSWAGGVVTVQTTNPISMRAGYGPQFTTRVIGVTPSGYNQTPTTSVVATLIGASTFTYPLASDPGPFVSAPAATAYYTSPGSIQNGAVPCPSKTCLTNFTGNSWGNANNGSGPTGIQAGTWFALGDANGRGMWDQNGWNSMECGQVGDPLNPLTAPTRLYMALYNTPNKQAINIGTLWPSVFSNTDARFSYWSRFHINGLVQCTGRVTIDRADLFIQIGSNAYKRFFLTDQPTLALSTTMMPCTVDSWSANSVTIRPRQGGFVAPGGNYLWWSDANNTIQQVGYCVPGFDFYISPSVPITANETTPGTLAQPWSINALNTKWATYGGKRVGLLPGTYGVSSLMIQDNNNGRVALNINGGTGASPTVVGSSDSNGNLAVGTAWIIANDNGLFGGGNNNTSGIIGQSFGPTSTIPPTSVGNVTLDGLKLGGGSVYGIVIGQTAGQIGVTNNVIIRNCEVTGNNAQNSLQASGVNVASLSILHGGSTLVSNCWFHDNKGWTDSDHFNAIYQFGIPLTTNTIIEFCSFMNTGHPHGKENSQYGTTIRYCYMNMTNKTPAGNFVSGFYGFNCNTAGGGTPSYFHHNVVEGPSLADLTNDTVAPNFWTEQFWLYNNTWINTDPNGQGGGLGVRFWGTQVANAYNNLMHVGTSPAALQYGFFTMNVDSVAVGGVFDYNRYPSTSQKWNTNVHGANNTGGVTTWNTLAQFQAAIGADAHSFVSAANPFYSDGNYAAAYKIAVGSDSYLTGRVGGVSGGAPTNVGAWDGTSNQIGCNFATFPYDFYISPTGSDSNAGTQASPWAITSINTKRATYAGKKVGVMDGTYNVRSLIQALSGDGYIPALNFNGAGGTAANPTLIQAINRGAAIIDSGAPTQNNSTIGTADSTTGYITLDGLKLINGGSKTIHFGQYSSTADLNIPGIVIQNCEITGQNAFLVGGGAVAGNYACIEIQGLLNPIIRNNWLHNNAGNTAGGADGNHWSQTLQWNTRGALYEYNTLQGAGFYGKETRNCGTTLRYNFVDNTGWTGAFGIQDFVNDTSTSSGLTTTVHHNVLKNLVTDMRPTLSQANYLADPFICFNNTFIGLAGGQSAGVLIKTNTGLAQYYNNIHASAQSGDIQFMAVNIDGPGVWDYNLYYSTGSYIYGYFTTKTTGARSDVSTLAAWKAAMSTTCEAHAQDHVNPNFVGVGSGASFYQIASGAALTAGSTTGLSSGAACQMGAWGNNPPPTIGSSLGPQ